MLIRQSRPIQSSPDAADDAAASFQSFDEARRRTNLQGLLVAAVVAFLVVLSFAVVEYYVVPDRFALLQVLRACCLVVVATIAVLAFRGGNWTLRHVDALTIGAFLTCGWYSIALMSLHEGYESDFFLTLVFAIVGVGAVTVWPLTTALIYMTLIIASYLVPWLFGLVEIVDFDGFLIHSGFLLGMGVISVVAQQLRHQIQKREFHANRALLEARRSLEVAYARLKELDQAKSDFFANVSHELRTPLTLSLGTLESLLKIEHPPAEEGPLRALQRNQLRLLRLINQLLDVAKVESGGVQAEFRRREVGEIVRGVMKEVEEAARAKELEVSVVIPSKPLFLYMDREKFEQLLLNLLSNAFKFTERGGRISVSLQEVNGLVDLRVADTGSGIPKEKLDTIFDRFTQADSSETRQYAGTGIGLALVQSYAELHGGTVRVESEPGAGTVFTVSFPRGKEHLRTEEVRESLGPATAPRLLAADLIDFEAEREDELDTAHAAPEAPDSKGSEVGEPEWLPSLMAPSGDKARVLVVDDNRDMRSYLSSLLNQRYEIKTAKNGAEGLAITKEWDPDLVLSDVMMPVMSGSDLCKAIKQGGGRLSQTPVLLVTARTEEQAKLRGLDYGADDYLLKPFLQEELLLRVRNLVTRRRQERALYDAHLTLRAQQESVQSDLELAREFQDELLSKLDLPEPLRAHVEYRPASVVGGDFYHMTRLGPSRVRLLVADMVDHGVKAAVRAAAAWPEYTTLDHSDLDPAAVLRSLNEVATSKYTDLSGSFLCLDLDVESDPRGSVRIRYARAGEMPFTVISADGSTAPPGAEGFMVGLFPNMTYQSTELTIEAGTRLFLYTDGLYTQTNGTGRTFREDDELDTAWKRTMMSTDIRAATQGLIQSLDRFRGNVSQLDDVTLIGIQVGERE